MQMVDYFWGTGEVLRRALTFEKGVVALEVSMYSGVILSRGGDERRD
jgi:hypothetical protein